jgi:hypothetical protein
MRRYGCSLGLALGKNIKDFSSFSNALLYEIVTAFIPFGYNFLDGLKGFILSYLESHVVVIVIDVLVDLVVNDNLILFVPEVEEDALFVPALGFPDKVFAVLDGSE